MCAELHRHRGMFLATIGGAEIQIEASFCEGIRIARKQLPTTSLVTSGSSRPSNSGASGWASDSRRFDHHAAILFPPMDMVPILAVGCFVGVRPDESARLEWQMIDFDRKHIDLPAAITKDGQPPNCGYV